MRHHEIDGTSHVGIPTGGMTMIGIKTVNIHAIFMDKMMFPQIEDATNWLLANGLKADTPIEDDWIWMFEQRQKSDFKLGAFGEGKDFRVVTVTQGVGATVGELLDGLKAAAHSETDVEKRFSFTKVDDAKRLVTGPVLVPNVVDLQGDFEFAEDIEKTAHQFMTDARNIGEMHRKFGNIGTPVESWVLRDDWFVEAGNNFKIFPKGTWMMTVHVDDEDAWKKVLNGDLNGFSIGFRGTREAAA